MMSSVVAFVAAVAFLTAIISLTAYTRTNRTLYDTLENWSFLVLFLAFAFLIFDLHRSYIDQAPIIWLFTVLGLAGTLISLVGQIQVMVGGVPFGRIAMRQTLTFGGILIWIAGLSWIVISEGGLPPGLGWLGLAAVVVGAAIIGLLTRDPTLMKGERAPKSGELVLGVVPFVGIAAWLIWLGTSL
jgi:hypothetical protein